MPKTRGAMTLANGATLSFFVRGHLAELGWDNGALVLSTPDEEEDLPWKENTVELCVTHPIEKPTHVFVPHLAPEPGNVIGDYVFRSPAVVVADDTIALAFVVDIDDVDREISYKTWLDYDHATRTITLAAGNYRHEGHVFFVREPSERIREEGVRHRLHLLSSTAPEDLANPYRLAARFCWERWGRPRHGRATAPPYAQHLEHIVGWAFSAERGWAESVWQRVEWNGIRAGAPVFIVDESRHPSVPPAERRWREPRSIWNQAWFSTQRCANGLLRYARQVGSADLEDRARQMTEIALASPQTDGLFPAVLVAEEDGSWRWTNSDRRPTSASADACHLVDAAFTCHMLLEWHAITQDARARDYVERFADRLVRLQRPSGAFPGWVEPDGRVPDELAEGPESAVSVALLLALGRLDPARRGLAFLESVARDGRWEDFETYYSCARWGEPAQIGRRVERNGVYKQNTLSIAWCAGAFLSAWHVTEERKWLALARRCIDELSLYQSVWDPGWVIGPTHGGFGVMNADAEWNDARQSLFATLYLELGQALGDAELVERGVSALRAAFYLLYCPENRNIARSYEHRFPAFGPESYGFMAENVGHGGIGSLANFTIYTWGNGSALAAVATVRDRFPEIARAHGLS